VAHDIIEQLEAAGEVLSPAVRAAIQGLEATVAALQERVRELEYWEGFRSVSSTALTFYGNCYRVELRVATSGLSGSSSQDAPSDGCPSFFPAEHNVSTVGFTVGVNGECGHVVNLNATHRAYTRAFIEYKGLTQLEAVGSRGDSEEQPACCPVPPGGGGPTEPQYSLAPGTNDDASTTNSCDGGGGGGPGGETPPTYRCYTFTVDHYWYYPETGRIEYRYTTETSWCEQTT
jgi:hypothetical protein